MACGWWWHGEWGARFDAEALRAARQRWSSLGKAWQPALPSAAARSQAPPPPRSTGAPACSTGWRCGSGSRCQTTAPRARRPAQAEGGWVGGLAGGRRGSRTRLGLHAGLAGRARAAPSQRQPVLHLRLPITQPPPAQAAHPRARRPPAHHQDRAGQAQRGVAVQQGRLVVLHLSGGGQHPAWRARAGGRGEGMRRLPAVCSGVALGSPRARAAAGQAAADPRRGPAPRPGAHWGTRASDSACVATTDSFWVVYSRREVR